MSDIKSKIEKVIDELEQREDACIASGGADFYAGKATAYHQSVRLLRELLSEVTDADERS